MALVFDTISGRTGLYEVTIFDTENDRSPLDVELAGDVSIEYGEVSRSSFRQVIKSYSRLNFIDENLKLHNEFKGGFKSNRYVVKISGPDVLWHGLIKEENREVPFDNRVVKNTTNLNCYGGIVGSRLSTPKLARPGYDAKIGARFISQLTTQLTIADFDSEKLRSDVELEDHEGNVQEVCQIGSPEYDRPINRYREQNAYKAVKAFARMSKNVLYKSLSEGALVWDAGIYIGISGDVKSRSPGDGDSTYSLESRSSFQNRIDIQNFIVESNKSGTKLLETSGTVIVEFNTDDNIAVPGAKDLDDPNNDSIHWERGSSNTLNEYAGTKKEKDVHFDVGNGSGSSAGRMYIGEINPTIDLGILLQWDTNKVSGSPSVTLNYRGNSGQSFSVSDASSEGEVIGAETTNKIDPEIVVEGGSSFVPMKVSYISSGKIVEELIAESDQEGVDEVVIDKWVPPLVALVGTTDENEPRYIRNEFLSGVENAQPFLYQAQMERRFRPFGTRTAITRLVGLYGPEYVHIVEEENQTSYWVSTGLKCNLKKGVTDLSLVEVPAHTLS